MTRQSYNMFKIHQSQLVINMHVFDMDIIPPHEGATGIHKNIVNDKENLQVDNIGRGKDAVHEISENEEDCYDSSSNESWKNGVNNDN